jgi:hypothetical protein
MRYQLDDARLSPTRFPPLSRSLESEFAGLAARIGEVLEQFDARIAAVEGALAVVHAMRNVEKIAVFETQRL